MTPDEHIREAEDWAAEAQRWFVDREDNFAAQAAAAIGQLHVALARLKRGASDE